MEQPHKLLILYCQYHACWCPGDLRSQGISSQGIDPQSQNILSPESEEPPVNYPHKGQWRGALIFPLIGAFINGWVNNLEAGDWRCHHTHYDVIEML